MGELPPEDDAVEMASAVHVLDSVAEVGPNYTLLRSEETMGHDVSKYEGFCLLPAPDAIPGSSNDQDQ